MSNQLKVNNGCICDSGCDSCARLAESWEAMRQTLRKWDDHFRWREDSKGVSPADRIMLSETRAALCLADRVAWGEK